MDSVDRNVYTISMDAIDFNLLTNIYNTGDDTIAPLWRKSNLDRRTNEYYQFEIKNKDGEYINDHPRKLEFENTLCHICDIEVPKPFVIEHKNSSKHKTNLRITNIAVSRMQRHMNINEQRNSCVSTEIQASVYFCEKCVMVVNSKERRVHEKSVSHKNSLMIEKVFLDLLLMYDSGHVDYEENDRCGQNTPSTPDEKLNILTESNVCMSEEMSGGNHFYTNTNRGNNDVRIRDDSHSIRYGGSSGNSNESKENVCRLHENSASSTNGNITKPKECDDLSKIFKNTKDLSDMLQSKKSVEPSTEDILEEAKYKHTPHIDYVKLLNTHKDSVMSFELVHNDFVIGVQDGTTVKIGHDNFHSFNRFSKNCTKCMVCSKTLNKSQLKRHKVSDEHMRFMVATLKDKHCERRIDDLLSHCLICNKILKYTEMHALSDSNHIKLLESAVVHKPHEDSEVETNADNSNELCIDNETEMRENENINNVGTRKNKMDDKNSTNSQVNVCTVCNDYAHHGSQHNSTAKHLWNAKSKYHYQMKEKDDGLVCKLCGDAVDDNAKDVKKHVFNAEHVKNYHILLEYNKIEKSKDVFYCKVCDQVLLIKNELIHVTGSEHRMKFPEMADSDNTEIDEDNEIFTQVHENLNGTLREDLYNCEICNVTVKNCENTIQDHIRGGIHAWFVRQNVDVTYNTEKKKEAALHYQLERTDLPNILNCIICKVNILQDEMTITEHLNQTQHSHNHKQFLDDNYLILKDNNYYCGVCKVSISNGGQIEHSLGKKHIKNIKQKPKLICPPDLNETVPNDSGIINLNDGPFSENAGQSHVQGAEINFALDNSTDFPKLRDINRTHVEPNGSAIKDEKPSVSNDKTLNTSKSNNSLLTKYPELPAEMLDPLEPTANPKEVSCNICKTKIPCTEYNVRTHINGSKHKNACEKLLSDQNEDEVDDASQTKSVHRSRISLVTYEDIIDHVRGYH